MDMGAFWVNRLVLIYYASNKIEDVEVFYVSVVLLLFVMNSLAPDVLWQWPFTRSMNFVLTLYSELWISPLESLRTATWKGL